MDTKALKNLLKHSYSFVGAVVLSEIARGYGETVGSKTGIAEVVANRMAVVEAEVDPATRATIFHYIFPSIVVNGITFAMGYSWAGPIIMAIYGKACPYVFQG